MAIFENNCGLFRFLLHVVRIILFIGGLLRKTFKPGTFRIDIK